MHLKLHNYIPVGKWEYEAPTAWSLHSARGNLMLHTAFQKPWPFCLLTTAEYLFAFQSQGKEFLFRETKLSKLGDASS